MAEFFDSKHLINEHDADAIIIKVGQSGWVEEFRYRHKTLNASTVWSALKECYKVYGNFPIRKRTETEYAYSDIPKYIIKDVKAELGLLNR